MKGNGKNEKRTWPGFPMKERSPAIEGGAA
jgi:hypothetical protein